MSATTTRPAPPAGAELADLLGPAFDRWTLLQSRLHESIDGVSERWVYGGPKYGWSCRFERGRKGILYMTPAPGHFRVGLAMSDMARDAVLSSTLPTPLRASLAETPKAMEGWPVRLSVVSAEDLAVAVALLEIKLSS